MAKAKQPVSIDGIEFDALLEQSVSHEADAPEYPTEKGFSVSDTVVLKAETISMTLYVTDTPVTWRERFGSGSGRVESVVKRLEELYFSRKVFSVVTSDAVYDNMVLTGLSIPKSYAAGSAREIPISLKKVIVTESRTVTIPESYGKAGTSGASAGSASTGSGSGGEDGSTSNASSSEKSGSILYNAAANLGLVG